MSRVLRLAVLGPALLIAAGCASPEARRGRGRGPGADPGNRGPAIEVHGPTDIYHRTPLLAARREERR